MYFKELVLSKTNITNDSCQFLDLDIFFSQCFLVGSVLLIFLDFCVVLSCILTFRVPCRDVRYDFRIKMMFSYFVFTYDVTVH